MEGEREGARQRRRKGGCEAKEEEEDGKELLPPSGSPRSFMGAAVALRSIT